MSARPPFTYPFPDELERLPRERSAVIEASAGTGKTHLIEHLVVDRLIAGDARLEEMLVVTFTERAAAELGRRVRDLIGRVLAGPPPKSATGPTWTIDGPAEARLLAAARAVDGAPISTIHAFCQRVLTEEAFASGRLLVQESVESRTAFAAAFAEVLRGRLATDADLGRYLAEYLAAGGSVAKLERLLYDVRRLRAPWAMTFEPERLARAAAGFAALDPAAVEATVRATVGHSSTVTAALARLRALNTAAARLAEDGHPARFLAAVDALVRGKDLFGYLEEKLVPERSAAARELSDRVTELGEASPPLDTVVAQLFGPLVDARLAARKRAAGLYDFDDMLLLVAEALRGERGPALIATLRRRFRLAVVDEFQDTDPVQWEIFKAIFHPGAAEDGHSRPLYLVGDPKQSIYGFRGADVATYLAACAEVATGDPHRLTRNFRSTPALIDAYNAILDQKAAPPFFDGETHYENPVVPGRLPPGPEPAARLDGASAPDAPALPGAARAGDSDPPLALLRVTAGTEVERLPMRVVRQGLADAIGDRIASLLAGANPPPAREIFVLTRTWAEAQAAAAALGARGVPHVLYNQEGLYGSPEARQVRDLLRAVADPHDPAKRLRAWLTPFFGLALGDLPAAAAADGDHPLYDRLYAWHAAAAVEPLPRLYARILDESGVILRELFAGEDARRLTNYRHLFDVLAADASRAARPLGDVVRRLSALCDGLVVPAPEEGNVQRLPGDRDAVQVMTMHKAKGLEAELVFLYGGYSAPGNFGVRTYTAGARRWLLAGRPRRRAMAELIKRERDDDDQRLYYVALTRARKRLYLPYSGEVEESAAPIEGPIKEDVWRMNGGYRHVNRRLRALAADAQTRHHLDAQDVPVGVGAAGEAAAPDASWAAWRATEAELAPPPAVTGLARLGRDRAGPRLTSYSRIKHAEGGYRPPTEILDEAAELPPVLDPDELPGGARAGIFLHDVLEKIPLESLRETPSFEPWAARADVRALLASALRRHGRDPRHLGAAASLAHAALTASLPVVGGALGGLAQATRVAREMEFLFPFPEASGGAARGFVTGFVDVIFEHEGRSYFGDWKTDRLPAWDTATVDAHVAQNYGLQERLYALALVKMLGVEDEAGYEARFGGTLYLFVRGLPGAIRSRRPSFAELAAWQAEVAARLAAEGTA